MFSLERTARLEHRHAYHQLLPGPGPHGRGHGRRLPPDLLRNWGRGYTITELISSKALCYHDKKTLSLLQQFPGEHPAAVQIFGSDPICMAEAAQIALEHSGADVVDLNMAAPWARSSTTATGPP